MPKAYELPTAAAVRKALTSPEFLSAIPATVYARLAGLPLRVVERRCEDGKLRFRKDGAGRSARLLIDVTE